MVVRDRLELPTRGFSYQWHLLTTQFSTTSARRLRAKLTGMDKKGRKMAVIGHDLGTLVHQANLFDLLLSSCCRLGYSQRLHAVCQGRGLDS